MVNISNKQIFIIVIIIVLVIWFLSWYMNRNKSDSKQIYRFNRNNNQIANKNNSENKNTTSSIEQLQQLSLSNSNMDKPYRLYYFYRDNCGPCIAFENEWKKIESILNNRDDIKIYKINTLDPNNELLIFYYRVSGTPTIILESLYSKSEYSGNRTSDDVIKFITNIIDNDK